MRPRLLILDEAFSGLDLSHRRQIIDLLRDLQLRDNLAYLCISHDIDLMATLASELAVMREGRIVERGSAFSVLNAPQDAYTRALVSATLVAPHAVTGLAG